jgi:(p)ppGpp synthase/HD superfamily hydrolase
VTQDRLRLTHRFDEAVAYANAVHAPQVRKSTAIPYLSHLLSVAALVMEDGAGDEDLVIGALLHDAAEDHGGWERLEDIRARFGDGVADIVEGCSDTLEDPKPSWKERKEAYVARLRLAVPAREPYVQVCLADKLHNARSILLDVRKHRRKTFERFTVASRDEHVKYMKKLRAAFRGYPSRNVAEFGRVIAEIEALTAKRA